MIEARRKLPFPNSCSPYFTTLANQKIALQQGISSQISTGKIHHGQIFNIDAPPLNVGVTEIWAEMIARDALFIEHFTEVDFKAIIQRTDIPMRRNRAEPIDAAGLTLGVG
ncbi:hypothetical protein HMP06_2295 [Sphingomonas sp. HMP6]|nr:hypothetical protein HMP06_2295 [Sphingomonas sp. HMP6]